jgi:hypothetical protein
VNRDNWWGLGIMLGIFVFFWLPLIFTVPGGWRGWLLALAAFLAVILIGGLIIALFGDLPSWLTPAGGGR